MGILDDIEEANRKLDKSHDGFVQSLSRLTVIRDKFLPPNGVVVHVGTGIYDKIKRWRKVEKAHKDGDVTLTLTGFDEKDG